MAIVNWLKIDPVLYAQSIHDTLTHLTNKLYKYEHLLKVDKSFSLPSDQVCKAQTFLMTVRALTDYFNTYQEMPSKVTISDGDETLGVTNNFTQFFDELPPLTISSEGPVPIAITLNHSTMSPVSSPDSYLSLSIKNEDRIQHLTILGKPIVRGYDLKNSTRQ